jgi:hypothetical protein
VHSYFLSRQIDLRGMIKFRDPKKALLEMVVKFKRERPKSRSARYLTSVRILIVELSFYKATKGDRSILQLADICRGHILWARQTRRGIRQLTENGGISSESTL